MANLKKKKSPKRNNPARPALRGKKILLAVTGSIAAYKSCELARRLMDEGAQVFCMMTESAQQFVTPLTLSVLSGNPVATRIWDSSLWQMAHLERAENADLLIVAPATADTLSRLAAGRADDLVTAAALSTKAPILLAPAMHERMWFHAATQENLRKLKSYGYEVVGPEHGPLSRGDYGWGRLAEISKILEYARALLS